MSYTVKFLDNDSFNKLPYKKVHESVGLADSHSGIAYVRDTGNPLDIFTAYHELEHLKGDDLGEHEDPNEPGIYYKSSKSWLIPLSIAAAFFAPQILPALSGASGAAGAGYAANAGAIGSGMGLGLGTGTAAGSAAASGAAGIGAAGAGAGALSSLGRGVAQGVGTNLATGAIGNAMGKSQNPMDSFNFPQTPSLSMPSNKSQSSASPAVSQVGGNNGGSMVGGGKDADKIRQLLRQNQSGFYSGRDAGGF